MRHEASTNVGAVAPATEPWSQSLSPCSLLCSPSLFKEPSLRMTQQSRRQLVGRTRVQRHVLNYINSNMASVES